MYEAQRSAPWECGSGEQWRQVLCGLVPLARWTPRGPGWGLRPLHRWAVAHLVVPSTLALRPRAERSVTAWHLLTRRVPAASDGRGGAVHQQTWQNDLAVCDAEALM